MATSGPLRDELTVDALDTLVVALHQVFRPGVTTRAHEVAGRMRMGRIAAERLTNEFG